MTPEQKRSLAEKARGGSGIEPIPGYAGMQRCRHPEHDPPGMIVVPAGHRLRHICPRCGTVQFVYSQRDGLDFLC